MKTPLEFVKEWSVLDDVDFVEAIKARDAEHAQEVDALRADNVRGAALLATAGGQLERCVQERDALAKRLDEAERLLRRAPKYCREDNAVTPGHTRLERLCLQIDAFLAHAPPVNPVPMNLNCPCCNAEHLDEGEWATRPHKTHQCQGCGHEWRPFEYATVGIAVPPAEVATPAMLIQSSGFMTTTIAADAMARALVAAPGNGPAEDAAVAEAVATVDNGLLGPVWGRIEQLARDSDRAYADCHAIRADLSRRVSALEGARHVAVDSARLGEAKDSGSEAQLPSRGDGRRAEAETRDTSTAEGKAKVAGEIPAAPSIPPGAICTACEGAGGFDSAGSPCPPTEARWFKHCGLCGGTGRVYAA